MVTISILANRVRPSVDSRSDDTAFGAGTFSWQDPLHLWKAGPGEFITVEKQQKLTLCISRRRSPSRRWSVHHNRKCVKIQGTICHKCTHVPLSAWKQNLTSKAMKYITIRDRTRFFDQVGHQTTNASIENKHFFTK